MKQLKIILSSFFSGVIVGAAVIMFMMGRILETNIVVLGLVFSFALFLIVALGTFLYTGQIGYLFEKKHKGSFLVDLIIILISNLVGTFLVTFLFRVAYSFDAGFPLIPQGDILETLTLAKVIKIGSSGGSKNPFSLLILSTLCGMCVHLAVYMFKREETHISIRLLGLFLPIIWMVIGGFEHSIALIGYLTIGGRIFTMFGPALLSLLIAIGGNSLGAILLSFILRGIKGQKVST